MKIKSGFINRLLLPATLIIAFILFYSCYYDSEEFLFPQIGSCDTTNYSFSGAIQPILENNCFTCHSNLSYVSGGGIKLQDYADVKTSADNGSLYGSINHSQGYSAMPKMADKLDDCKITVIKKWIDTGTPNN